MSLSAAAKQRPKPHGKPLRPVSGRTPQIKLRGDVTTSPFTTEQAETVIAAGKFKATCLQLLDRSANGETITITKRGKVVARLVPPKSEKPEEFVPLTGMFKGRGKVLGDIVSPDFEAWGMKDPHLQ